MDLNSIVRTINSGLATPQRDIAGFAYKVNSVVNQANRVTDFVNKLAGSGTTPAGARAPSGKGALNRLQDVAARSDPLLSVDWVGLVMDGNNPTGAINWAYLDAIATPDLSIEATSVFRSGKMKHYAGVFSVGTMTLTFYTDRENKTMKFVSSWFNAIYNNKTGNFSLPKEYKKQVHLYFIDSANQEVASMRFFGCFPTSLSSYNLENGSSNPIVTTLTLSVDSVSIGSDAAQVASQVSQAADFTGLFPAIPRIPNLPDLKNIPGLPQLPQWPSF